MCIHCLGHLSHPPPNPASGQNLFCPLVLRFCWRRNTTDGKKGIAFLLVWGKDRYTERFLMLLPCTSVLQPTLAHLCQTSSLLPGPLPIVVSASLGLPYSPSTVSTSTTFRCWISFLFPILPMLILPLVCDTHTLYSAYEKEHVIFGLLSLPNLV
jgi:hypothetical protein